MILLFTDFGYRGPYVGQMHAVLAAAAPSVPVIDLMHDAPTFQPRPAAYLLAGLAPFWSEGTTVVAVVDPGVGSDRRALAVQARGRWLVGPDNGLLCLAARRLGDVEWHEITWRPERLSATFHGRDLFAPTGARLALGDGSGLSPLSGKPNGSGWPTELAEVIYADAFGNLMTGLRPRPGAPLAAGTITVPQAETFSGTGKGQLFWYENSLGLVEIAINQGSARDRLSMKMGDRIDWK
jgi:S-adenosyl-L-methionine hydrolase (adenosine-forming)